MVTIILISTGTYFVFCGVLLIALLRSAARTSADWNAYALLANVRLLDACPDPVWAHSHVAAGTAHRSGASISVGHIVHHATEVI